METWHAELELLGAAWQRDGRLSGRALKGVRSLVGRLHGVYSRHIPLEDWEIYVVAAQVLSPGELREMSEEMRCRRSTPRQRGNARA